MKGQMGKLGTKVSLYGREEAGQVLFIWLSSTRWKEVEIIQRFIHVLLDRRQEVFRSKRTIRC
jgi:hypothetical protein